MINICVVLYIFFVGGQFSKTSACDSDEFPCFDGECIRKTDWCDGEIDCLDGSDENYCSTSNNEQDPNGCLGNSDLFKCGDGKCIPNVGRCDGFPSCADSSDEKNCEKMKILQFTALNYDDYTKQLSLARDWLLSQRNEDYGWGDDTPRAIIAMYLTNKASYVKDDEDLLMDKQLDILISIALTRDHTNKQTASELALYINALTATCSNPRKFYGYDLVDMLRDMANSAHSSGNFVSPYVYLTLCINNYTSDQTYEALKDISNHKSVANKMDMIALSVLASSCFIKKTSYKDPQYHGNIVLELLDKIKSSGLPGNIYELAIVVQALDEAKVDPSHWHRSKAMKIILKKQDQFGSFGDILATYYTVPILSGRSMLSLSDHCHKNYSQDYTPLANLKHTKNNQITVLYSLFFADPNETRQIQLRVPEGTNFLDIMHLAEDESPKFRFSLDNTKNIPFVDSIGGIPNNAEHKLYWTLHTVNHDNTKIVPYNKDIRKLIPEDHEEIIFWLKAA